MQAIRFLAPILCIFLINAGAAWGRDGTDESVEYHPGELLPSMARYLASNVSVSGSSSRDAERAYGHIYLVGDELVGPQHRLGLNYRDSVSHRENQESSALMFTYGASVSDFSIGVQFENSESAGVTVGEGNRFDSESEHDGFKIDGSRPLVSWHGFSVNSLFSHSAGSSSTSNANGWAEDVQYQVSKFGVEVREDHTLLAGLRSSASLRAFGGVDSRTTTDTRGHRSTDEQFEKVLVSASLRRDVRSWTLGMGGHYQFAASDLPSSEQFQVAGPTLSLGFNGQSRYANEGGWLRLQADSPTFRVPVLDDFQSSVQMSVLRGWTPGLKAKGQPEGGASVGEVSLQLSSRDVLAALSVGKMLMVSDPKLSRPGRPDVSFSIFVDM